MKTNDDIILEVLHQGYKVARWPSPRHIKIFIASTKSDFTAERRQILEVLGPELQALYDEKQIEIEFVDMYFGTDESEVFDPCIVESHFSEIRRCHELSKGCFFLCLIGNQYGPFTLPVCLDSEIYSAIVNSAKALDKPCDILNNWYKLEENIYVLKDYKNVPSPEWKVIYTELTNFIHNCALHIEGDVGQKLASSLSSAVERELKYALSLSDDSADQILVGVRNWKTLDECQKDKKQHTGIPTEVAEVCLAKLRETVKSLTPEENLSYFETTLKSGGIDPDEDEDETYLNQFKEDISDKLQNLINDHLERQPELTSRKKIVQENFQENITHVSLCYEKPRKDPPSFSVKYVDQIKEIVLSSYTSQARHSSILIYGNKGSGKTSLLQSIFHSIESWFTCRILRICRFIATTPRSTYSLELLRLICQQICIALKLPEGFLPKDASFDPLYVQNWFQTLLRNFEERNQVLAIFIDDLHLLNPLDTDIIAALSWLPVSLPKNVFIFCTTGVNLDQLILTPVQKERLRNADSYLDITAPEDLNAQVEKLFNELETEFGMAAISRLASLITCSEFGFTETELLELLMPTSNSEAVISLDTANFNFSSMCYVREKLAPLIREKHMSGKLLIEWRHHSIKELAQRRYLSNQETLRTLHAEIATLCLSEFSDDDTNSDSEEGEEPAPLPSDVKETPFQSILHPVVAYSLRHVEESWIHLLKSGDVVKLKTLTVCNFDFLLAAVQTVSISYLRCVLEHVRCYILDRELELVYHTIRKSTDILTRDPLQLGTQIISWLRPVTEHSGGLMSSLLTSAMAWCDGFTLPLVVPLTGWLQPPLPAQSRTLTVSTVRLVEATPNGQHVVCVADSEPQLWHIMSNQLVHTFKGHSGRVLCMAVTKQSQYLLTGSEDTSIIVWDLRVLQLRLRIYEHIAPVLCLTSALNNSVIVSGSDDSSIIISSLATGQVVMKIDHHRGPVTAVKVTSAGDVLVSGSHDQTVCLWSLETYTLLNTITMGKPVCTLDVSADSVFLLVACDDNNLYLRTLATGTELHCLVGHKARVRTLCIAQDSHRAVVGCSDGKVYIFEMHSGKVMKILSGQLGEVTAVRVTENDDFLLTAGGSRVNFYPFRSSDAVKCLLKLNKKSQHHLQAHSGSVSCVDISRDGLLSVTGSTDHLVNIWLLNTHELLLTLDAHKGPVVSVSFAPNGLFVASGSEDKTVKIWGLTLGSVVATFMGHHAPVSSVLVMMDSCRVISSDRNGMLYVWLADNGSLVQSYSGPHKCVAVTNNMKYTVATDGDNSLKIWSLIREDEKYTVTHSDELTCMVMTMDSLHVITGSKDMSLKVWQVSGGKLAQVLVGHTDAVTCVAVAVSDKSTIVSGSCDTNLIVWDINTGSDLQTLTGHLSYVTCVKISGDGTVAASGSDDKSIIIWDTKRGLQLTSLQLHIPIISVEISSDCSRMSVHLKENQLLPIICLHNSPAKYVKLPTYCAPAKDIIENTRPPPKRQLRRLLKKEVSLDTYTWQKKYGHLTSNAMIAAVDERLKRRFSVSASMEEISKIAEKAGSQAGLGPEQAALAQSQHFDQLEALWNKRSPPRRRLNQSLSKQSSLAESRFDSSEEDEHVEGSGRKLQCHPCPRVAKLDLQKSATNIPGSPMVDEDVMKNTFPSNNQDVEKARPEHPEGRLARVKRILVGSVQNGPVSASNAEADKCKEKCKPRKRKERQESISLIFQERKVIRSNSEERPTDVSQDIRRVSSHEDFKKKQPLQVLNISPKSPTICEISETKDAAPIKITFQIDEFLGGDEDCEHEKQRVAERFSRPLSCRGRRNYLGRKRKEKRAKENGYLKTTLNKEKIISNGKSSDCKQQQQQQPQQIHPSVEASTPTGAANSVVDESGGVNEAAHTLFLPKQPADDKERTPSPVNSPISPVLDLSSLHEQIDCTEPVLSTSKRQIAADDDDVDENVTTIPNRLLSSPRNSIIMTRRIYLDRDVPMPSTALLLSGDAKNPVEQRLNQLTKQINSIKRKIKKFEDEYERKCGYRPSHSDKMCDNSTKVLYVELSKLRKEHKQLKNDPAAVVFGVALKSSGSMLSLESQAQKAQKTHFIQEAFVDVEKQLSEKRTAAKRTETLEEMSSEQLMDEKVAVQKALLHLESTYGRPTNKDDRDCVRPLYDRYRSLKRLIARISMSKFNSSLNELATIHEYEASDFADASAVRRNSESEAAKQALSTSSTDDSDTTGTSISENLHSLSLDELKQQQRSTNEDRKNLRRALKEFEHDFQQKTGRKLQKEDKSPMESTYNSYKTVKAKLRLLEALLDKYKKSSFDETVN